MMAGMSCSFNLQAASFFYKCNNMKSLELQVKGKMPEG
jgi:hypothetical protein